MKKVMKIVSLVLVVMLLIIPNPVNISATKSTHIDDDFFGNDII